MCFFFPLSLSRGNKGSEASQSFISEMSKEIEKQRKTRKC